MVLLYMCFSESPNAIGFISICRLMTVQVNEFNLELASNICVVYQQTLLHAQIRIVYQLQTQREAISFIDKQMR